MEAQKQKEALLAQMDHDWAHLHAVLSSLSDADLAQLQTGYGWSLKDVVVHLAAWEQEALVVIDAALQGQPIADYSDADTWNARFYQAGTDLPPGQARADLVAAVDAVRQRIAALPAEQITGTVADWATVSNHFADHLDDFTQAQRASR
jgi:hypothetical protein